MVSWQGFHRSASMKSKKMYLQNINRGLGSGYCKRTNFSDGSRVNIHQFSGAPEFVWPSTFVFDHLTNLLISGCWKDCHNVCTLPTHYCFKCSRVYILTSARSLAVNYVQEALQGTNIAIAYVYCDYENPKTHSELKLLSSIARQLTEQTSSIPLVVKEFCEKGAERRRNPTGDELISLVESICLLFQTTYVFIDALVTFLYPIICFGKF